MRKTYFIEGVTIDNPPEKIIGDICTNSETYLKDHYGIYCNNKNVLNNFEGTIKVGPGADPSNVIEIKNGSLDGLQTGNLDKIIDYCLPIFPDFPENLYPKKLNGDTTINSDGKYSEIIVKDRLNIYTGSAGEERNIRVSSLEVKNNGKIEITGEGKLNLYVENEFDLNGIINHKENVDSLMVYYKGNEKDLKIKGGFYGLFFSTVDISLNGNVEIIGNIVTSGNIKETGNPSITGNIYAPNGKINITGSTNIKGAVVANEIVFGGNGGIVYSNKVLFPYLDEASPRNTYRIDVWSD